MEQSYFLFMSRAERKSINQSMAPRWYSDFRFQFADQPLPAENKISKAFFAISYLKLIAIERGTYLYCIFRWHLTFKRWYLESKLMAKIVIFRKKYNSHFSRLTFDQGCLDVKMDRPVSLSIPKAKHVELN